VFFDGNLRCLNPVQTSRAQPTATGFERIRGLAKRHTKQDFQRQTRLNDSVTELPLPTSFFHLGGGVKTIPRSKQIDHDPRRFKLSL
jgi:hypothetical protein